MLELDNISVCYGNNQILKDISAKIERGRLVSIIGVNGCGKSTLLKAVLGILPLSCGNILIDDENISEMSRNAIAKKIAYLAQGKSTPDMTVEQLVLHGRFPYLSYPRRYSKNDRDVAFLSMQQLKITEYADSSLTTLSGGIRQKAYIAMSLAQDTDYILLDEPTTYLDITHQLELMKNLRLLAEKGKGIITVMHDLPMAFDFSDEIILIKDGKIAIHSTPKDICNTSIINDVYGISLKYSKTENKYFYQYFV